MALGASAPPLAKEAMDYFDVPDLNLQQRMEHPLQSKAQDAFTDREGRWSTNPMKRFGPIGIAAKGLGGPYIDTIADLMTGQVEDAIYSFAVPSQIVRLAKEGIPETTPELVKVLGLKKYTPPAPKRKRKRRKSSPLPPTIGSADEACRFFP